MMTEEQKKTAPEMAVSETESKENLTDTIVAEAEEKSKCDYELPRFWDIKELKQAAIDYLETIEAETYNDSYFGEFARTVIRFIGFLDGHTED